MTTEQLQRFIHAQPFRPFWIHLADGRKFRVPHPDFIAHKPGSRIAMIALEDLDAGEYIDLLLVVSLAYAEPAEARPA